jgi:ATP-dependent DNA helicase RecG
MKITELIIQPEGRRLEFKAKMPAISDIAKTIVAFANDAGGELFIGIRNEPRELVGVKEDSLIRLEEQIFPYAKIECARFKGTTSHEFIDQKTITVNIMLQPEAAYEFVLRHINMGAVVKGVYTESRWEYPVVAIREVIRNAVVHRDYSLAGKDIKVAVYDDMVEITSPGKLMPSIDFSQMEARQSDIRNRIIAPVFKKLGIIDQWGNGLKLISDELKDYPEIEFRWHETGLQFQVQFVKKGIQQQELQQNLDAVWQQVSTKLGLSWHQVGTKLAPS